MAQLTNLYNADLLNRVARAGKHIKSKGFTQLTDEIGKQAKAWGDKEKTRRDEIAKKGQDKADEILELGGSLDESWQDVVYSGVEGMQEEYVNLGNSKDKLGQQKKMNNLNELSTKVQEVKDINTEVAQYLSSKDTDNNLQGNVSEADMWTLQAFQDPNSPKRINPKSGVLEVMPSDGEGEWVSAKSVQEILNRNKKSPETELELQKTMKAAGAVGLAGGDFNRDRQVATFKKTVNENNLRTVINDDVLGVNSSFSQDFQEGVMQNIDYASIDPEGFESADVDPATGQKEANWFDVISDDDQARLYDAVTNPDNEFFNMDFTNDILANYFADKSETEFNNAKTKAEGKDVDYWLNELNK